MPSRVTVNDPLVRIDSRKIEVRSGEIHAVVAVKDEAVRLPDFLEHHRKLGVDRFFFIDNRSTDGTREHLLAEPDCHVFDCSGNFFRSNVHPPLWCNALRNAFCMDHWCLSLDADELLIHPHHETVGLRALCAYLDRNGADALETPLIDMYASGPVRKFQYRRGTSLVESFPYFDRDLGEEVPSPGVCPPILTFSKFRVRAFWTGAQRRQRAPCITKVGLVRWRYGMNYTTSQHALTAGVLADIRGALLHFKFLPGFFEVSRSQTLTNRDLREKGLSEREAYVEALMRNPDLTLMHEGTLRFEGSGQLVDTGWMRTSAEYEDYVAGVA